MATCPQGWTRRVIRPALAAGLAALLAGLLAACSPKPALFRANDITGVRYATDFSLTDHTGRPRSLADSRGKVVLLFFGFTHCPDVCPTTLAEAAGAMRLLGDQAERVQVLFITLDPERDTPALLARYVPAFDARFLGLHGSPETIAATAKAFRVVAQKVGEGDDYTIDHTAGSYLYDPQGRVRLFAPYGSSAEALAADLQALLSGA